MRTRLLGNCSIEATPAQWGELVETVLLPAGSRVYVPALPRSRRQHTAATCASIRGRGFQPVPHLAARAMGSRTALADWLLAMRDAGAESLLLVAGDRRRPAGPFANTLAVLDSGLLERVGFRRVGIAGHPEGHPRVRPEELAAALRCKTAWARATDSEMWIVTQFAFSAQPVIRWYAEAAAGGVELPVYIGMPGPAKLQTLIRFAAQCGIGASARVLAHRPGAVSKLLGRWTPGEMLAELVRDLVEQPSMRIAGLHVFPFGGLRRSIEFLDALRHDAAVMQRTAVTGS